MTYEEVQIDCPSFESNGEYNDDTPHSKPISAAHVNTLIGRVDNIVEAAYGDSSQAIKDELIIFLVCRRIGSIKRWLQEQGRDQFEKGDQPPPMDWSIPQILKDALIGSKGDDYPQIDTMKMR